MPEIEKESTYGAALREAAAKAGIPDAAAAEETSTGPRPTTPPSPKVTEPSKPEPYHPLLADLDLSELDEPSKVKVLEKVKTYDRQFHRENTSYKAFKQFQNVYQQNTAFADEVDRVVAKHYGKGDVASSREQPPVRESPAAPTTLTKRLDQLLAKAETAEERESIREARQIVSEETAEVRDQLSKALKEVEDLKRDLSTFRTERQSSRLDAFDRELDALESEFSSSLVERYRDTLRQWSLSYPSKSARWILYKVAEPDELEEAKLPPGSANEKGKIKGTKRPAPSVTPSASEALEESQFKTGTGKARRWDTGAIFRHFASRKAKA